MIRAWLCLLPALFFISCARQDYYDSSNAMPRSYAYNKSPAPVKSFKMPTGYIYNTIDKRQTGPFFRKMEHNPEMPMEVSYEPVPDVSPFAENSFSDAAGEISAKEGTPVYVRRKKEGDYLERAPLPIYMPPAEAGNHE